MTSARAFELGPEASLWINRNIFVVGRGTAEAAENMGVSPVFVGRAGGAELVSYAASQNANKRLYHIGGQMLSLPLQEALNEVSHTCVQVYTRERNPNFDSSTKNIRLSAIASPAAAHAVSQHPFFRDKPCVCIGSTTALEAKANGLRVVGVCSKPSFSVLVAEAISAYSHC